MLKPDSLQGSLDVEPLSLALALGILFVAALVAVGMPTLRASALQPAETLRQE
jgi:ABC-type lipoprotein release transport system permease subunit